MVLLNVNRWQSVIKVFSVAWFLYGNYLVFYSTAVTCALTAPHLFNLACMVVLYGYILYGTPLITLFLQHVLIPCIIGKSLFMGVHISRSGTHPVYIQDILQLLHIIERGDLGEEPLFDSPGASSKEIAELPTYHISSTAQDTKSPSTRKDLVCHNNVGNASISIPSQDCVCVICLSPYNENDVLCQLW